MQSGLPREDPRLPALLTEQQESRRASPVGGGIHAVPALPWAPSAPLARKTVELPDGVFKHPIRLYKTNCTGDGEGKTDR